jgi:hypothetical protein
MFFSFWLFQAHQKEYEAKLTPADPTIMHSNRQQHPNHNICLPVPASCDGTKQSANIQLLFRDNERPGVVQFRLLMAAEMVSIHERSGHLFLLCV